MVVLFKLTLKPLHKRNEVKFNFSQQTEGTFPVKKQCEVMNNSRSGYNAWRSRPAKVINKSELMLYRRTKALFKESRQSLLTPANKKTA
jgi:hypothetical protein